MFCPNCGTQLPDGAAFCGNCGSPVGTVALSGSPSAAVVSYGTEIPFVPSATESEAEVVDLTNQVELTAPREKRYSAIIWSSLLLILGWIVLAFFCFLLTVFSGVFGEDSFVIFSIGVFSLPVGILGLIFVSLSRRSAKNLPPVRKGWKFLYSILSIAITSLIFGVATSQNLSSLGGLAGVVGMCFVAVLMIVYFAMTFSLSMECGKEGLRMLLNSYFISFIPACILGWLAAKALIFMAIGLIIMILAPIVFFAGGGRVVYHREYY